MHKISMNKLLMGLLVTAGVFSALSIPPAQALDLGKALEEAVKSKVEEVKNGGETPSTPAAEAAPATPVSTTTNASPVATTEPTPASAQPEFNWKKPSKEEEIALGREITGSLLGAAPLVKDEALQKYVNQVGRWVANQSERADLPWKFGVIDSSDINAFAAPGGYVLITKGLYQKLQNLSLIHISLT